MDMNEQRVAKAAELRDDAMRHRDRAEALDALGRAIRMAEVPIERWRSYWNGLADEARRQANNARAFARECDERAATVDMAVSARNGWQPAPATAHGATEGVS